MSWVASKEHRSGGNAGRTLDLDSSVWGRIHSNGSFANIKFLIEEEFGVQS